MSVTPEFWHPAGEIYISRPVTDPMFEYATQRLRSIMGPHASLVPRDADNAAITLINEADMHYALRRAPQLREYTAEEIENELLEALVDTRDTFYRARLGEIALLKNPDSPLKTLAAKVIEPAIVHERRTMRNTVNRLAGTPVFGKDKTGAHVSYAQFARRFSDQALKKFKDHIPDTYKVDVVKSKPLQAAA